MYAGAVGPRTEESLLFLTMDYGVGGTVRASSTWRRAVLCRDFARADVVLTPPSTGGANPWVRRQVPPFNMLLGRNGPHLSATR